MLKFLKRNGVYLLAAAVIFIFAFANRGEKLSPAEFAERIRNSATSQVVDVRTPDEYKGGYIKNSINIDWKAESFDEKILKLDKTEPVFIYCLSGARSSSAGSKMRDMGFTQVYELDGGIMAWKKEGFELLGNKKPVKRMDKEEFFATIKGSDKLVLVDFYAPWCGPCKKMEPYLEELAVSHAATLKVWRINADEQDILAEELNVDNLPTVFLYRNGKKIMEHTGFISKAEMLKFIDKN